MNESVNVAKAALVKLLDAVLYPNPDDPGDPSSPWGPYGPIGPVIRWALRDLSWVLLNPQPLPPRAISLVISGALRDLSWVLLNPQPLPPRDIGALQKVLGRFRRRSTSAEREDVVYGKAVRLGFSVLLILAIISLSVWLLRSRSREETASVPLEADEEAVLLEDEEVVVPPGAPTPREEPF